MQTLMWGLLMKKNRVHFKSLAPIITITMFFLFSQAENGRSIAKEKIQKKSAEISFAKEKIKIGSKLITVEIADNHEKQAFGLMYRSALANDQGMLFVFSDEQVRSFWMKNTFVPLSIGYFDSQKKLIDIQDMKPAISEMQTDFPSYASRAPAQYALEMSLGWFQKNKIKLGQRFERIK